MRKVRIKNGANLFLSLCFLNACSTMKEKTSENDKPQKTATAVQKKGTAKMHSTNKSISGIVSFEETGIGTNIIAQISGLKPKSAHGLHIHEFGKCEGPDFKTAGAHFNPFSTQHGGPAATNKHIGDFGNIVADNKGRARKEIFLSKHQLNDLSLIEGKAIILHSGADDLTTQPSGDSGDRLACGLIKMIN